MLLRAVLSLVCHQRPERCLSVFGAPIPLCARCTGIYAGTLLGALAGLALARRGACRTPFLFALLTPSEWCLEQLLPGFGSNGLRLAIGLLSGLGIGVLLANPFRRTRGGRQRGPLEERTRT